MVLLAKRVKAKREPVKMASTSSADEKRRIRSKISAARSLVSIPDFPLKRRSPRFLRRSRLLALAEGQARPYEYAVPTRIFRKRAGLAPCPVPTTCCGWPLPQLGVPHNSHSSREQIASIEFQNSVVIPEYDGFFSTRTRLPFLISQAISQPN